MTIKQRILTIRVMEKVKQEPEYARKLGVTIHSSEKKEKSKY